MSETKEQPEDLTEDQKLSETLRMWSAISFALIILGLGLPLWWKTTEVYRVALPYSDIEDIQHIKPRMALNLSVYTQSPSEINQRIVDLKNHLASSELFDFRLSPVKLNFDKGTTVQELEEMEAKNPSEPGSLKLIEFLGLPEKTVLLGNHRAIYFHPEVATSTIVTNIRDSVLREKYLEDLVASLARPGSRVGQEKRLKAEPCFDIIFTVVNPEPDIVRVSFDAESAVMGVIDPLLSQLKLVADLKVKTQWLYFVDFGVKPNKTQDGYKIAADRIPHIITPLEKKLGSGVSKCPCLNFILYIPSCEHVPLYFATPDHEELQSAMVSPRWGGIQIHNPLKENCENRTRFVLDSRHMVKLFVGQLRHLLDIREEKVTDAGIQKLTGSHPLRDWEADFLYRAHVLEHSITARLTLQSLSRLLGEISNIVINEEVGSAILASVANVASTFHRLASGQLRQAIGTARQAYISAETAFSHPSLLALLYFPDDQKYAVYIPLFLPVMIPVVLSLKNIWKWVKKSNVHSD